MLSFTSRRVMLNKCHGAIVNSVLQVELWCTQNSLHQPNRDYTEKPRHKVKPRSPNEQGRHFVDFKRVYVKGGGGGSGMMSFLSLFANEYAGPDGGDGGNAGHIIFKADSNYTSLNHLASHYTAIDGEKGGSKNCHGKCAEHKIIEVPLGTLCRDDDGVLLADLKKPDAIFVAARGGAGGRGNRFFLSNEDRAPMVYEKGARGEERHLLLELRTIAHAGLIGFPNAGKSTLLRALSRARPKVASYPFTTLNPHVGMVEYEDRLQVAVADIPGLIKGAHQNYGLGISFLRHIERCVCLLYVLDLSQEEPWTQLTHLKYELEQYKEGLSQRPHAIIGNKIDLQRSRDNLQLLKSKTDLPIFAISAKKLVNIDSVLTHLRQLYDANIDSQCDDSSVT